MAQSGSSTTATAPLLLAREEAARDPARSPETSAPPKPATPTVDLRIVLFTVAGGALLLSLQEDGSRLHLPGGQPRAHESLDAGARRLLRAEAGLTEQYLEQLYTVSASDGDAWRVIVTYLGLVTSAGDSPPAVAGSWHNVVDLPPLSETDRVLADYGALRLRAKLSYTTIAFHLLPPAFTLSELQGAYEAILGRRLDKRNFRRHVITADFLTPTGEKRRVGSHRPALLYRFRAIHDRETYLTPNWTEGA
jgi:8-oxo-dGTP diphosphatase